MKQFIPLLATAFLFGFCHGNDLGHKHVFSTTCARLVVKADVDKTKQSGLWIQQGGSVPCENCCSFMYIGNEGGDYSYVNSTSQNWGKASVFQSTAVQNPENKGRFTIAGGLGDFVVLNTNYNSATVTYTELGGPALGLFTRSLEMTKKDEKMFKDAADQCNMKIYWYKPSTSCKGGPTDE